jgi:hypothetical protein
MSSYSDRATYSQASDWVLGAVRRNPEAVLLLAASCCLLMRSGSSQSASHVSHRQEDWGYEPGSSRASSDLRRGSASPREGLSSAAESASDAAKSASDYASQVKDRVSQTASSYADSVTEFADDARRTVSEHSTRLKRQAQSTLQSTMQRVLREQPLALAVAGLAAGAAVAAVLPSTDIEDRALGGTHEKLRDAAEKAGTRLMDAAGKAGERLKSSAEERGLTSEGLKDLAGEVEGLKDLAGEVTDTFTSAVSGKPDDRGGASAGRESPAASTGSTQSLGIESKRDAIRSSDPARSPGGRSNR